MHKATSSPHRRLEAGLGCFLLTAETLLRWLCPTRGMCWTKLGNPSYNWGFVWWNQHSWNLYQFMSVGLDGWWDSPKWFHRVIGNGSLQNRLAQIHQSDSKCTFGSREPKWRIAVKYEIYFSGPTLVMSSVIGSFAHRQRQGWCWATGTTQSVSRHG